MTLSEKIAALRTENNMSQGDLAEKLEVSRQSVSKWETGQSTPELEKIIAMSELFNVSVDELVKDKPFEDMEKQTSTQFVYTERKRTAAQKTGIFFLCLSAFLAILFAIMFGFYGMTFVLPFLLFGLICYFVKNHAILKACWVDYFIVSIFLHYCTGINPSNILLTFYWEYSMNYGILFFSWVWFAVIVALVSATVITFRKTGWTRSKKQIIGLVFGIVLFLAGGINGYYQNQIIYFIKTYMRLTGMVIIATDLVRWIYSKKHSQG